MCVCVCERERERERERECLCVSWKGERKTHTHVVDVMCCGVVLMIKVNPFCLAGKLDGRSRSHTHSCTHTHNTTLLVDCSVTKMLIDTWRRTYEREHAGEATRIVSRKTRQPTHKWCDKSND